MDIEALVQRAQVGDGEALSALVKIYQMPAPRVAQAILDNLHDAEDAVQDAWLLTVPKLATLREPAYLRPRL